MSTPEATRRRGAALVLALLAATAADAAEGPALGTPVDPASIVEADLSIAPDGANLPPGSGDAIAGARVFTEKCAACHGAEGRDGLHDALVGGQGTLASAKPVKTVGSYWPYATTVFDYVRRAMPYQSPRTLTAAETYAVTAFLLHRNGIIGERERMDARSLPRVKMPNRDSFRWTGDAPPRTAAR